MKISLLIIMLSGLIISHLACKQPRGIVEKIHDADDIKIFYAQYGKAIANADYKHVAELYSNRGAIIISQGHMMNLSLDSIRALYLKNPLPESDFRFEDVHVDFLGDSSAMVDAVIHWHQKEQTDTTKLMYTAVLLKTENSWKIRQEHESSVHILKPTGAGR